MKTLLFAIIFALGFAFLVGDNAKAMPQTSKKKQEQVKEKARIKLVAEGRRGTNFNFEGSRVSGQYKSGGETASIVENEKVMQDLLSVRTDFKDRIKKSFVEQ